MTWQRIRIARFGGPDVLELVDEEAIPHPDPGEVRIKVLAAGTGFTDTIIRRGRYPEYKGPLPFTPGYELVGIVEEAGAGVTPRSSGAWWPISMSSAATRNMRSGRRAISCRFPTASIPPRPFACRLPI